MSKFNQMADRLMELPTEISDLQLASLDQNQVVMSTQEKVQVIESRIKSEINNLVDLNGKKVHSNEDARKAAFIDEVANNTELAELKSIVNDMQVMIQEKRIKIEALSNEQRHIRSLLNFFSNSSELAD